MTKWLKKWWIVILILGFAFFVRSYQLDKVPVSLYYDEVDLGYQVRSLLETHKDYRGTLTPFFTRSFNTDKTPIPIYWSILGRLLFRNPALQVRMPTAVAGTFVVALGMALTYLWTEQMLAVAFTGIVMATSPWLVQFSRIAFEAMYALLFFLGFLVLFNVWLRTKKTVYFYLAVLVLSLSVYTYRITSLYAPLTFIMIPLIYFRELRKLGVKHLLITGVLAGLIIGPFLYYTTLRSKDQTRIDQIKVFSDPLVPIMVLRNREIDSGDYKKEEIGKQAVWSSFIFHNKYLSWAGAITDNYLKSWSTEFLFISGDPNPRHSVGKMGELLLPNAIPLLLGISFAIHKRKEKKYQWLLLWLFTSPIPADLTIDGAYHASRLILMVAPLQITIGLGWWQVIKRLASLRIKIIALTSFAMLFLAWVMSFAFYIHRYLVHFPLDSARAHSFGYEQTARKIAELAGSYDRVMLTNSFDPPMMYFIFWANIPPKMVQEYGTEFGPEVIKKLPLDKYKVMDWSRLTEKVRRPEEISKYIDDKTIYMVTHGELEHFVPHIKLEMPTGVKLLYYVNYPDNSEVAFYLITKDTQLTK